MKITGHRSLSEFSKYLHIAETDQEELANSDYAKRFAIDLAHHDETSNKLTHKSSASDDTAEKATKTCDSDDEDDDNDQVCIIPIR